MLRPDTAHAKAPTRTLALLGAAHVHLPDHLDRIAQRGWSVAWVHDRDPDRCASFCESLAAKPLTDLKSLTAEKCDGAIVCSETRHHEDDVSAALDAGLPVFCEKPLGGSAKAAHRMADQAERAGLGLYTAYFMRTNPTLRRLHDILQTQRLGTISHARMRFSHDGGYADWLDLDCWMTDPGLACYDGFVDEAVHCIDTLSWLVGPITSGHAVTGNALGWSVDDHGAAVVKFESGATGVIEAGWTDTEMRLELDIIGQSGRARLLNNQLSVWESRDAGTAPDLQMKLERLDAGAGIEPFLDTLANRPAEGLVAAAEAARVNTVLDAMGLRLCD